MSAELISWVIALEVALPFILLTMVLAVALIQANKKNKVAVRKLILKIKNNDDNQKEILKQYLTQKLAMDEKQSKTIVKKIINERKFLFRNLISGILDKSPEAITNLDDDLSRITGHYHALDIEVQKEEPGSEEEKEQRENIEELQQEVKTLKHEVHVTLTTLNNIFAEFSSMFGEEVADTEMSVDQIITAMETFSTKSESDTTTDDTAESPVEEVIEEPDASAEPQEDLDLDVAEDVSEELVEPAEPEPPVDEKEELDFSIDSELDDIDSALDDLELGQSPEDAEDEPSWDDAFEESGDTKDDDK